MDIPMGLKIILIQSVLSLKYTFYQKKIITKEDALKKQSFLEVAGIFLKH